MRKPFLAVLFSNICSTPHHHPFPFQERLHVYSVVPCQKCAAAAARTRTTTKGKTDPLPIDGNLRISYVAWLDCCWLMLADADMTMSLVVPGKTCQWIETEENWISSWFGKGGINRVDCQNYSTISNMYLSDQMHVFRRSTGFYIFTRT